MNTEDNLKQLLIAHHQNIIQLMEQFRINKLYYYLPDTAHYIRSFAYKGITFICNPKEESSITNVMSFKRALLTLLTKNNINSEVYSFEELAQLKTTEKLGDSPELNETNFNHIKATMIEFPVLPTSTADQHSKNNVKR
jgi:hypothetical protein